MIQASGVKRATKSWMFMVLFVCQTINDTWYLTVFHFAPTMPT